MAPPKILFTSVPVAIKIAMTEKIHKLGGEVIGSKHNHYETECTHLLIYEDGVGTKPTERILAALAAGEFFRLIFYLILYTNFLITLNHS